MLSEICLLTQQALSAAKDNDWQQTQTIINQRDKQLHGVVSQKLSELTEDMAQKARFQLESIAEINEEITVLSTSQRDKLLDKKSKLEKNKKAINSYLDHSSK